MRILTVIVSVLVRASHAQDPAHASPPTATEKIRFESGDFTLVGDLLTPPGSGPHPTIVYVWGSGPTDRTRHIERSRILHSFLDAGFAVVLYDKPGSGSSTGVLGRSRLLAQRAAIVTDALAMLREHPAVRPGGSTPFPRSATNSAGRASWRRVRSDRPPSRRSPSSIRRS